MDAPVAQFIGAPEIIQKRDFAKNKILAPPEFLFFRRITIFQLPMVFSLRRSGLCSRPDLAVSHHRQPATKAAGAL